MKIVITGTHGFIGSHLATGLEALGHEVIGIDRQASGALYRERHHDLRTSARKLLQTLAPDLVVHLAAHVGRLFGEDDMIASVADNAQATTLLAADCRDLGIRMAYSSTSEVYGDRRDLMCREGDPCDILPHNLYGLSKRWGEEACRLYVPDLTIFRLSMPYGPGVPPGRGRRALDTMLWQAYHGLPITVHEGAERSWCWIDDTIAGMVQVLTSGHGGIWNIGRDDACISMLELARSCCALVGRDPAELIEIVQPPQRQTVVKRLSTEKLRALGWEPAVDLDVGLPRMLEWVTHFDADLRFSAKEPVLPRDGRAAATSTKGTT